MGVSFLVGWEIGNRAAQQAALFCAHITRPLSPPGATPAGAIPSPGVQAFPREPCGIGPGALSHGRALPKCPTLCEAGSRTPRETPSPVEAASRSSCRGLLRGGENRPLNSGHIHLV